MRSLPRLPLVVIPMLFLLLTSRPAAAESTEREMGKSFGYLYLATLGSVNVALDITNIVFLSMDPDPGVSRIILPILSILGGTGLLVTGSITYVAGSSGVFPADGELKAIFATHLILGVASIAIGIWGFRAHQSTPRVALLPTALVDGQQHKVPGMALAYRF